MLSCSFNMFWTTANSQTSSEEEMKDFDAVEPTVIFGSRSGIEKGTLARPCFHSFGLVAPYFWRKSRAKRSFWGLGDSLVENARFGDLAPYFWRKSRKKRLFWRLGASLLEEVSHETPVLETWRFTFGGSPARNSHFGDLALHLWSWTQTWPVCGANEAPERAFWSWT